MSSSLRRRSGSTFPQWARALLLVGFLSVVGAALAARSKPATGYEVSIYQAPPVGFWVGVLAAATIGVVVALYGGRWGRSTGIVLDDCAGTLGSGTNVLTGGYPLRVSGSTGESGNCLATLKNLERLQSSLDDIDAQRLASTLSGATCIDGGTTNARRHPRRRRFPPRKRARRRVTPPKRIRRSLSTRLIRH